MITKGLLTKLKTYYIHEGVKAEKENYYKRRKVHDRIKKVDKASWDVACTEASVSAVYSGFSDQMAASTLRIYVIESGELPSLKYRSMITIRNRSASCSGVVQQP